MTSLRRSWHATASTACVARLGAVAYSLIDDAVDQWPTRLHACVRAIGGHFEHVTVDFFFLYLMNFMFHTMLDALDNILRVNYKCMKCDGSFSQGSVSTLFRWGEHHVFHVCVKCSSCLQQYKNYNNQTSFSRIMVTNVLPRFYESQCRKHNHCRVAAKNSSKIAAHPKFYILGTPIPSPRSPAITEEISHARLSFFMGCVVEFYRLIWSLRALERHIDVLPFF